MAAQQIPVIPMVRPMEIQEVGLPEELKNQLKAPLPPEAIKAHPRLKGLSSINAAFVIMRMNEVFGPGGYQEKYREISTSSKEVDWKEKDEQGNYTGKSRKVILHIGTVHGTLSIPKYGIHLENYGGAENEDLGDALKGACTDAFTKMCSHLGVGLDVYMSGREAGNDLPPCPRCGKMLRKSKDKDELYCWVKKDGCGATFSPDELKAAIASKNGNGKPPQPAPQQRTQAATPTPGSKFTISAAVTEKRVEDRKAQKLDAILWLMVGKYRCASKDPAIWTALNHIKVGSTVTLLVSEFKGQDGPIHQIHKVIPNAPERGGQQ